MRTKNCFQFISGLILIALLLSNISTAKADCKYEKLIDAEEIAVGVLINWSTSHEKNNAMFIVEKSTDGLHFVNLGAVKGAGESLENRKYSFLDVSPGAERVYYRLRQINYSGTYSFSEVLNVYKKQTNHFMVTRMSAIAATDQFEVNINSRIESNLRYSLLDWKGNVLNEEEMPMFTGLNKVTLDLEGLPEGVYRLELQAEEEVETLTFKKVAPKASEDQHMVKSKN